MNSGLIINLITAYSTYLANYKNICCSCAKKKMHAKKRHIAHAIYYTTDITLQCTESIV